MNPIDDQLNRLFRAAARAESGPADVTPPFGMETRMLAAWRDRAPAAFWDTGLLVRGLIVAAVIMAVSLWPAMTESSSPASDSLLLADSTIQVDNSAP